MGTHFAIDHYGEEYLDSKQRACHKLTRVIDHFGDGSAELLVDWFDMNMDDYYGMADAVTYEIDSNLLIKLADEIEEYAAEEYSTNAAVCCAEHLAEEVREVIREFGNDQYFQIWKC